MRPVYDRFWQFLPWWALTTAALTLVSWKALQWFAAELAGGPDGRVGRSWRYLSAPLILRRDWAWLTFGCAALLLITDYHGFTQGFFRWDDFAFIQDAREARTIPSLLRMYHNDHSLPLFRLWVSGVVAWAGGGATADELARAFNMLNFLTCLSVLVAGVALLSLFGVKRIAAFGFCLFAWFWPGWGEFTTGYYTLMVYPQTLVCGFLAIIMLVRYLRGSAAGWMALGLGFALVAGGLDISGIWVFFAIGGFAWAIGGWRNRAVHRLAPWLLLSLGLVAYYHLAWFHHPYAGREFVQNPRGLTVGHSLASNLTAQFWRLPLAVASGLGGTLLSEISPGFIGMTAPQFHGNSMRSAPIYVAEALVLVGAAWVLGRGVRRLTPADTKVFFAFALPVVIIIGMTAIARLHTLDLPGSLWPTKYLCLPQAWAVLAAFFLVDRAALSAPEVARNAARWMLGTVLVGFWLVATFWILERSLGIEVARRPAGRQGNAVAASLRRSDFNALKDDIEALARITGSKQLDLPQPVGIYWTHPYLEFGFDPVLGGTYMFADLLSVAPATGITLRERPREEVSPDVLAGVDSIPTLKRVFESTPPTP